MTSTMLAPDNLGARYAPDAHSTKDRLALLREPHFEFLDPANLHLFRDDSGRLRLTVEGERSYLDVKVVRAFPFSGPGHYIGFLDGREKLIGLVVNPANLDADTRRAVDEALKRQYFIPIIHNVCSLREEFGAVYLDVETDWGRRQFVAKGIRDAIVHLGEGQLLISDVDGNRFRIADWRKLNPRSQRYLERVV